MSKSYEKWVATIANKLQTTLNLHDWDIQFHLDEDDPEGDPNTVAWVCSDYRYLTAHVYLTPGTRYDYKDKKYDQLGYVITHELVHLMLKPIQQFAIKVVSETTEPLLRDAVEQTVQRITRVVINNLPKNFFSV